MCRSNEIEIGPVCGGNVIRMPPAGSRPISTSQFRSNWALSAARAIAVVEYLIGKGVAPQRLVAAGFGEFQPLDNGTTEEAFARNRRIELKLTER